MVWGMSKKSLKKFDSYEINDVNLKKILRFFVSLFQS